MEWRYKEGGGDEILSDTRRARRALDLGQTLVLRDLADLYREGEAEIFDTHGAAIGATWRPLAASTQKARARLSARFGLGIGPTDPRLVLFGDMRAALTTKGGAQEQRVVGNSITVAVDQARINRHDRSRGLGLTLTKTGKRRKARGRGARYPDNILDIHEQGLGRVPPRPMIGVPAGIERRMDSRVERFFDNLFRIQAG